MSLDQLGHCRDIASGAKGASGAGDHYDMHVTITGGSFESLGKIAPHVSNERI
jgi:hypothetical protein